jgi:hypothetical protein
MQPIEIIFQAMQFNIKYEHYICVTYVFIDWDLNLTICLEHVACHFTNTCTIYNLDWDVSLLMYIYCSCNIYTEDGHDCLKHVALLIW